MHVEPLLVSALKAEFPSPNRVVTETPANLHELPSCMKVVGIGGTADRLQFGLPNVDVDVYAPTRIGARDLAVEVETFLLQRLPGMTFGTTFVLSTTSIQSPTWVPYDNPNLHRFVITIGLRTHDRSSS